jgi:hydroxyacylglutathione hydrolase
MRVMIFQQIVNEDAGCIAYLIGCGQAGEAVVVDPGRDRVDDYLAWARRKDLSLTRIVDTHIHADHLSGNQALEAKTGARIHIHPATEAAFPHAPIAHGDEIRIGTVRIQVIHTPGHTPDSICLLVTDLSRGEEPWFILTGDTLFVGDVGRPDFGGGDAEAQFRSMARLLALPDWVAVFPGHFEGPCGKGMCGRPSTTIGFERRFNRTLGLEHDTFLATITAGIPARPLNMTAIEATNRGAADMPWAMLTSAPAVDEVGVAALRTGEGGPLLLDVREPEEYVHGHIAGAVNIPQADLASRLGELPRDRPLLIICQLGMRSVRAAQFLKQAGFTQVATVRGGTSAWCGAGRPLVTGEAATKMPRVVESLWSHAGASSG